MSMFLFVSMLFSIFCIFLIIKNTLKNYKKLKLKKEKYKLEQCINNFQKYNEEQEKFNLMILEMIDIYGKSIVLRAYCIYKKCSLKKSYL